MILFYCRLSSILLNLILQTSSIMPPPLFRNVHAYQTTISGDAPTKQKANGVNQPLRRKYMDEARLKKVGVFHLIAIIGCRYL